MLALSICPSVPSLYLASLHRMAKQWTLIVGIFDVLPEGPYVAMKWLRLTPVILVPRILQAT